jgi:Family of unknown function (DUF6114)
MAMKPTTAFVLSLVGGIFVLLGGLVGIFLGAIFGGIFSIIPSLGRTVGMLGLAIGGFGAFCGIMMIAGGFLMYMMPQRHAMWGAIVTVFSILSWVGAFGGFVIGFLLGLVGGILGIAWKSGGVPVNVTMTNVIPVGRQQAMAQQQVSSFCSSCGSPIPGGSKVCNACGAPI